jgi:GT2 family glycosyltransferase
MPPILIAVLMTTHNRVATARKSLVQFAMAAEKAKVSATVFLTNSGSNSILDQDFSVPKNVQVLEERVGANSFWAQSMRNSWLNYDQDSQDFNYVLWLNDDTFLFEDAISQLIDAQQSSFPSGVIIGSTCSEERIFSYGGLKSLNRILPLHFKPALPVKEVQTCDTFNGNIVLIDASLDRKAGGFPVGYTHLRADLAFGLDCKKKSIMAYVAPGFHGECEPNVSYTKYADLGDFGFRERLRKLNSPKFGPISEIIRFSMRFGGILGPLYALTPIVRALFAR